MEMTVSGVAAKLHVSERRVREYIGSGRLRARRDGRSWWIEPDDLKALRIRAPGRPRKTPITIIDPPARD